MSSTAPNKDLTAALNAYAAGERQGAEELMRLVYARLRDIAEEQLRREGPGHTLQPTALVNEAHLRLAGQHTEWRGRSHFYAIAARAMRRVLIDHARSRDSAKRGGGRRPIALSGIDPAAPAPDVDLLALDEALERLSRVDPDTARVVEMRFFGGMEMGAIVEVTGIPERTIRRHWVYAKAWLARELGLDAGRAGPTPKEEGR